MFRDRPRSSVRCSAKASSVAARSIGSGCHARPPAAGATRTACEFERPEACDHLLRGEPAHADERVQLRPGPRGQRIEHAGCDRIEIVEHLYSQDFERESNSVEVLVGRVRCRISPDIIRTRRGFGYVLGGENGE